jgi:hypothetical protein
MDASAPVHDLLVRNASHWWEPAQMPWTPDDAERHTHKATTWALKEFGRESPTNAGSEPAMTAAQSGKQTQWLRAR